MFKTLPSPTLHEALERLADSLERSLESRRAEIGAILRTAPEGGIASDTSEGGPGPHGMDEPARKKGH